MRKVKTKKSSEKFFDLLQSKPYLEHWLRINRLLNLIQELEHNKSRNKKFQNYRFDIFLAFFILCYHLRDWLTETKLVKTHIVDEFIQQSYELQLCRNICLGLKHFNIRKPSKPQLANFSETLGIRMPIVREYSYFSEGEETKILADGKSINAFELAIQCVKQWTEFLQRNKLL